MVERLVWDQEVVGSNPIAPTILEMNNAMTVATTGQAMQKCIGWRKARRAALADNPFIRGEGLSPKARRELLGHSQLSLSPRSLLRSLVVFVNSAGGHLLLGVADDRQIIGVENPLDEEERLSNLMADSLAPRLLPNIELITVEEKMLLVVEVFVSGMRPHFIKSEGLQAGAYVRLGSTNRQVDPQLIAELQRGVAGVSFDALPMPDLLLDDLDLQAIRKDFEGRNPIEEQTLQSLRILVKNQGRLVPSQGGVLLYGRERQHHFEDA